MALAQGILDIVLDVADDHAARTVRLRVGELHAVTRAAILLRGGLAHAA